jgi:hypothetical protein
VLSRPEVAFSQPVQIYCGCLLVIVVVSKEDEPGVFQGAASGVAPNLFRLTVSSVTAMFLPIVIGLLFMFGNNNDCEALSRVKYDITIYWSALV